MDASRVNGPLSPQSVGSVTELESSHNSTAKDGRRSSSTSTKITRRSVASLACLNCRPKKVKCQLENGRCRRCTKFGLQCFVPTEDERRQPSSKKVIRELESRITSTEEELRRTQKALEDQINENKRLRGLSSRCDSQEQEYNDQPPAQKTANHPLNMLAAICGGQYQLNRDEGGQLRFFGPTSSLHVTENVSSSILNWAVIDRTRPVSQWQSRLSPQLQQELLHLYWTYQHPVLQVVHRKAFLDGMAGRRPQYYSELLHCCVIACAARMSTDPEVRALSLATDDPAEQEEPFFVKTATALLEVELRKPNITTVQSLLLLSVIYCARSGDTKGWLCAGDACRLAVDLGLHRDCQNLGSSVLSSEDLEVRQVVFWGCFVFDRLWALYLGRPHCIRLNDITVPRLESNPTSDLELQMAGTWAGLLEIVGYISEMLNGSHFGQTRVSELNTKLLEWLSGLPPALQYSPLASPTIHVLHLQYSSAMILLHRPAAGFGSSSNGSWPPGSQNARLLCVTNAYRISQILLDYETHHGSVMTMSGVALHTIATAATTLIADSVENGSDSGVDQLAGLRQCIRALSQLEKSYLVTRRVRKIIQIVMRLLDLDLKQSSASSRNLPTPDCGRISVDAGGWSADAVNQFDNSTANVTSSPSLLGWDMADRSSFTVTDSGSLLGSDNVDMGSFHVEDFIFPPPGGQSFLHFLNLCPAELDENQWR